MQRVAFAAALLCTTPQLAATKPIRVLAFNAAPNTAFEVRKNVNVITTVAASAAGSIAVDVDAEIADVIEFAPNVDLQPPVPPVFSALTSDAPGCAHATWQPSGDPTVVGYVVSFGTSSVATGQASQYDRSVDSATPAYTACTLAVGRYYFAIRTKNYAGMLSAYSTERTVDIVTVSVLITQFDANVDADGVHLAWRVESDEVVKGYRVYRRDTDAPELPLFADLLPADATAFVDENTQGGMNYTYVLVAVKENGDGVRSAPVTVTTPMLTIALEQNVPNPFNPKTTIAFTLAEAADVTLRIHDVRGALVATLLERGLPEGRHEVEWSGMDDLGSPVSSGVYFYTLTAGKQSQSKKMMLVK